MEEHTESMETEETNMQEDGENEEVEMLEVSLTNDEIDSFIEELEKLKETQSEIRFDISDDTDLLIRFEEDDEEEEMEGSENTEEQPMGEQHETN